MHWLTSLNFDKSPIVKFLSFVILSSLLLQQRETKCSYQIITRKRKFRRNIINIANSIFLSSEANRYYHKMLLSNLSLFLLFKLIAFISRETKCSSRTITRKQQSRRNIINIANYVFLSRDVLACKS